MIKIPKYDFICDLCDSKVEAIVSFEESEEGFPCEECNEGMMERQFPTSVNFQVRWGRPAVRSKVKRMGA